MINLPNNPTNLERHNLFKQVLRQLNREEDFEFLIKVMAPPPPITSILPPNSLKGKRVGVLGAGVAGLASAYELRKLGCDITILEANHERIGGRVYTHFFSNDLYGEFGPMRLPLIHETTWYYINEFKLPTNPFIQLSENNILYVKNQRFYGLDIDDEVKRRLYPLYNLTEIERNIPFSKLIEYIYNHPILSLNKEIRPLIFEIRKNYPEPIEFFDNLDFRGYLTYLGFSKDAINMIYSTIGTDSGFFYFNFIEILKEYYQAGFNYPYEITGGIYKLPYAFYESFKHNVGLGNVQVKMGTRVTGISDLINKVKVQYLNTLTNAFAEATFDYVVCAIPFSCLRLVDKKPLFSNDKMAAIDQLNFSPSQKSLILFNERFWEREINNKKILGGRLITDLPIISTWFPSRIQHEKYGVVSVYNMNLDTTRLTNVNEEYRIYEIISQLEEAFGYPPGYLFNKVLDFKTVNWNRYIYTLGALTKYYIRQYELFSYPSIVPEYNNKVFFAGEHTSGAHGWVQGGLQSGMIAANMLALSIRNR